MLPNASPRLVAAIAAIAVGALLLAFVAGDVATVPTRAHRAFDALIIAQGGSMAHSPTYPDTYRTIVAQTLLLCAALLGATGVVLVAVGAGAVLRGERPVPNA